VAYETCFYIGQVTKKVDDSHVIVKFLERKGGVHYQWPKKEDIATVETKFVFTKAKIVPEGKHFELKEPLEGIQKLFKTYKKKYFEASLEEVVYTGTVEPSKTAFYFWLVDGDWQREKCFKLGLDVNNDHPTKNRKLLERTTKPSATVSVKDDGNCFFRAISYWLTGSEDQYEKVRSMLVSYMKGDEWKEPGRKIIGEDVDEYLANSNMDVPGVWATETEIHAMAHLLDTTIFVYHSFNEKHYEWLPHYQLSDKQEKCIYLVNPGYHFEPVTEI
jgi:hypothetical protein